jgi:hypothetical protein
MSRQGFSNLPLHTLQYLDIIRPLIRRRVRHVLLTHRAFKGIDGLETHFPHPGQHVAGDGAQVIDAVFVQRGGRHGHVGAGQQVFDYFIGALHAGGSSQRNRHAAVQNGDPKQGQPDLVGRAVLQVGQNFQLVNIKIGLVKTVEQHQRIGAGAVHTLGHRGHGAEVRIQFDGHGYIHVTLHRRDDVQIPLLHLRAAEPGIRRYPEYVDFQSVGAGLHHLVGVFQPALRRGGVQAGNHRHIHPRLGPPDQIEVLRRADMKLIQIGKIVRRLGEDVAGSGNRFFVLLVFPLNLLFEQRKQYHGPCAGVFHAQNIIDILRQRAGRNDDRGVEGNTHVGGAEIHVYFDLKLSVLVF